MVAWELGAADKQQGDITKGQEDTSEGDGHGQHLGCGDPFMPSASPRISHSPSCRLSACAIYSTSAQML